MCALRICHVKLNLIVLAWSHAKCATCHSRRKAPTSSRSCWFPWQVVCTLDQCEQTLGTNIILVVCTTVYMRWYKQLVTSKQDIQTSRYEGKNKLGERLLQWGMIGHGPHWLKVLVGVSCVGWRGQLPRLVMLSLGLSPSCPFRPRGFFY